MKEVRLGDVATVTKGVSYGKATLGSEGPNMIGMGNVVPGRGTDLSGVRRFSGRVRPEQEVADGDLAVVMTDLTQEGRLLGAPAQLFPSKMGPVVVSHHLATVRPKSDVDPRFLYYVLCGPAWRHHVRAVATGTTVRAVSTSDASRFRLELPARSDQITAADTLSALDDKIESNHRIARVIEDLGLAVFDAAAKGRQQLGAVSDITMGASPPGSTYNESADGLPFYQGVRDFGPRHPKLRVWCTAPTRTAEAGDTLVAVRAPVGRLNRASERCAIGRGLAGVCSAAPSTLYYALLRAEAAWAPFAAEGTVFGAITSEGLRRIEVSWPELSALDEVEAELAQLDDRLTRALHEISTLAELRDTLLPELLSGGLTIEPESRSLESVSR